MKHGMCTNQPSQQDTKSKSELEMCIIYNTWLYSA